MENKNTKKTTCVYIDSEILEYSKQHNISLSSWICDQFYKQHFIYGANKRKIEELSQKIGDFKQKITEINQKIIENDKKSAEILKKLLAQEQKYLQSIPEKLERGFELASIYKYFINTFDSELAFVDFINLIDFLSRKNASKEGI